MLSTLENWVVNDMTRKQVRHLKPVHPSAASGKVGEIYRQIRRDFQLVPPLTMFSPSPELLAGVWSMWRESQFVRGTVSSPVKETIAAAVSHINQCPYCVDAHSGMLHASSDHAAASALLAGEPASIPDQNLRDIANWASASRSPESEKLKQPPFNKQEMPEIVGTALTYHFVNRMVSLFLTDTPMPVPASAQGLRRIATRIFGATIGKRIAARQPVAGASLKYVSQAALPEDFAWASENSNISAAFAGCIDIIEREAEKVLPIDVRNLVLRELAQWNGEDVALGRQWLDKPLTSIEAEEQKPAARLALLTAFAPYQIDDTAVQAFRESQADDDALLAATAWASMAATRRVASWLVKT